VRLTSVVCVAVCIAYVMQMYKTSVTQRKYVKVHKFYVVKGVFRRDIGDRKA